jgi:uncharacterized protein YjdB
MICKRTQIPIKSYFAFFFFINAFLFDLSNVKAQFAIDDVSYQLKYNSDSCHYEVLLIVNQGSTTTIAQRIAFNAQVSLRYASGNSKPTIKRSYYPVGRSTNVPQNNQWAEFINIPNPSIAPGFSYISFIPNLGGISAPFIYKGSGVEGSILQRDTIRLFSLNSDSRNCGSDIRLYINESDPSSVSFGGVDFTNAFTIESASNQVYTSNQPQVFPQKPIIANISSQCSSGIAINLTATSSAENCNGKFSYMWSGPAGYSGSTKDVNLPEATSSSKGLYSVTVTDSIGCSTTASINAFNKPKAGNDITICANNIVTLTGTEPNTGTWRGQVVTNIVVPTGPGVATYSAPQAISPANQRVANFIYTVANPDNPSISCTDTVSVTINPNPLVGSPTVMCVYDNSKVLTGLPSGGTWTAINSAIADVTNTTGAILPMTAGLAKFKYSLSNGCNNSTNNVKIDPRPLVSLASDTLCLNGTTNINPFTNGTWSIANPSIASISGATLTANVVGQSSLIFTVTATAIAAACVSDPLSVTVLPIPTTNLVTPTLCAGQNGQILPVPNVLGTWLSSNPSVAVIDNGGVISAIAPGTSTFTFKQNATQCASNPSASLTVITIPLITGFPITPLCSGLSNIADLDVSPSIAGKWRSSNTSIAIIDSLTGVISTVGPGFVNFTFTNSEGCSVTSPNMAVSPKPAISATDNSICVGTTTGLRSSNEPGTWSVLAPTGSLISYNPSPVPTVTGLSAGIGRMVFSLGSNCCSDTISITVNPRPIITLVGDDSICVAGTTRFTPSSGGFWSSSNLSVASISATGIVTGISQGNATFTFRDTNSCVSLSSSSINVVPPLVVTYTGSNPICVGNTTSVIAFPSVPGVWSSTNPSAATIDPISGIITGVAPGFSIIRFTEASLGCISNAPDNVVVNARPSIAIDKTEICQNETAQLGGNPSGGQWTSSNPSIATANAIGLVIPGAVSGTVQFTYTNLSNGCPSLPVSLLVKSKPTISSFAVSQLCVGGITTLSGSPAGGSWSSESPDVASISPNGVITAINPGSATFIYTSASGCRSNRSAVLTVDTKPTISPFENPSICIGGTTSLTSPSGSGKWTSLDPMIARVDSITGIITGLKEGLVAFQFTSNSTSCNSAITSTQLSVIKTDNAILASNTICVGNTTNIAPSTGGTWLSSDASIAEISNSGLIIGKRPGAASFIYTNLASGCKTAPSAALAVTTGPTINPPADNILCLGETTIISNVGNTIGSWSSINPFIASINPNGLITAKNPGTTRFVFTDISGCQSQPSSIITIRPKPTIALNGGLNICVGATSDFNSSDIGTWTALNPTIATIEPSTGLVTGLASGVTRFIFISSEGCPADTSAEIRVGIAPIAKIIGRSSICVNDTSTLSPNIGGVWTSSDNQVAVVSNDGIVTSRGAGVVSFTFISSGSGCTSSSSTGNLTVNAPPTIIGMPTAPVRTGIAGVATLSVVPASAGTWISNDPSIATISPSGVITTISIGIVNFSFINANGCSVTSTSLAIAPQNGLSSDRNNLCIGESARLSSGALSGTWTRLVASSNVISYVASPTPTVVALSAGAGLMEFTSNNGIKDTLIIIVRPRPIITLVGNDSICISGTTGFSPSSGGFWSSSNLSVASISATGIVTGISQGNATFTFRDTNSCVSLSSSSINVVPPSVVTYTGLNPICVGNTTSVIAFPSVPGVWSSTNPSSATIDPISGIITGVAPGFSIIRFTEASLGCISVAPDNLVVNARPSITIDKTEICQNETAQLGGNPSGGQWTSSNPSIATANAIGLVTPGAVSGTVQFTYSNSSSGCPSLPVSLLVKAKPTISTFTVSQLCVGGTTTLPGSPSGGSWSSESPAVASISSSGVITAVNPGSATFIYTSASGCRSNRSAVLTVDATPIIISSRDTISLQDTFKLSLNSFSLGTWKALDTDIATIDNGGNISIRKTGKASFQFTTVNGCKSTIKSIVIIDELQVLPRLSIFCYTDANKNNIFDEDKEFPLPNCVVSIQGINQLYYSGSDGYVVIDLPKGPYKLTYTMSYGQWEAATIKKNINFNKPLIFEFAGFKPIIKANQTGDVVIKSNIFECKKNVQLKLIAHNTSSEPLSGYLSLAFDQRTFLINSKPLPVGGNGDTLIWAFNNLQPGKTFTPDVTVKIPDSKFTGDTLSFSAKLINRVNNQTLSQYRYVDTIRCNGRNQNEMNTWPNRPGLENFTFKSEEIIYTVDFQNKKSGNREVVKNIKIFDELDPNLDAMSLRIISSTYPVSTTISGNMLLLEMKDVNLVDDAANFASSQGYVSFAIRPKATTANGVKIYNLASIQLDNSPKRFTTTALNTIVSNLLCSPLKSSIVLEDRTLKVSSAGKKYYWYNCDNNFITSLTTNDFKPSENGSYFAYVEGEKCDVVTECFNFISTSNKEINQILDISISPNPAQALFNLDREVDEYIVRNIYGQEIKKGSKTNVIDMTNKYNGVYYVELISGKNRIIKPIIKID